MQAIFNQIDRVMSQVLGNQVVSTTLTVFLVLYAVMAAPNLPPFLATLFDNTLFKILVLFLVFLVNNYDPTIALLSVIGFVISLQTLNRYRMFNMGMAMMDPNAAVRLQHAKANVPQAGGPSLLGQSMSTVNALGSSFVGATQAGYVPQVNLPAMAASDVSNADDMQCAKPQPFAQDLVLPPQPPVPEQVAAVMNPNCQYMGPQGMKYPQGYAGTVVGANFGTCDSEL